MTREEKAVIIDELKEKFANNTFFYIADAAGMTVNDTNRFRRLCFERGVEYVVVKNSLIKKALETTGTDYTPFDGTALKGFSGVMLTNEAGSIPAKLLKEFRKGGNEKPLLKGASIDGSLFIGEESLETLSKVKSRLEMIAQLLGTIQAPGKSLASALQSSGSKLAGVFKTLEEKKS
ncbi:MAG: 50S ribosomal protein L10 [Bacteroidetes bacterium]|nr:MAG: 50S ribosomal protein L10 [Bacteroidota bacterium]TAG87240.1 MAG: 50S ribosomal protein L10 [Bacteroidota bacterium]